MQFQLAKILRAEIDSGTKKGKYALKKKAKEKCSWVQLKCQHAPIREAHLV